MVENKYFIARWALFMIEPDSKTPGNLRIGIQSKPEDDTHILIYATVFGGENIPDMVKKIDDTLKKLNISKSNDFSLIYSNYGTDGMAEINIAHMIKEEAEKNKWGFDRKLPAPDFKNK